MGIGERSVQVEGWWLDKLFSQMFWMKKIYGFPNLQIIWLITCNEVLYSGNDFIEANAP